MFFKGKFDWLHRVICHSFQGRMFLGWLPTKAVSKKTAPKLETHSVCIWNLALFVLNFQVPCWFQREGQLVLTYMASCHKWPIFIYLRTCHIFWKKWVEMTHKVGIGEHISRSRPSGFSGSTFQGCLDPNDSSWSQGWPQILGDIREWDWPTPQCFFSEHDWHVYRDHRRTKGWTF